MNSFQTEKINILVVEDHAIFRRGLVSFLKCFKQITKCDDVRSGELAIEALEKEHYHIVLLDRRMEGLGGLKTAQIIKKRFPEVKIIVMTGIGAEDKQEVIEMINLGIDGYIYKGGKDDDNLEKIMNTILQGGHYFNPEIEMLIAGSKCNENKYELKDIRKCYLSPREIEIALRICDELTNREIAEILSLSFDTIKSHRKNIYDKFDIDNSIALVDRMKKYGYLK